MPRKQRFCCQLLRCASARNRSFPHPTQCLVPLTSYFARRATSRLPDRQWRTRAIASPPERTHQRPRARRTIDALTGDARAPPVVGAHRHAPASACKHRFKPVVGQFRPTLTQAALLDREPFDLDGPCTHQAPRPPMGSWPALDGAHVRPKIRSGRTASGSARCAPCARLFPAPTVAETPRNGSFMDIIDVHHRCLGKGLAQRAWPAPSEWGQSNQTSNF